MRTLPHGWRVPKGRAAGRPRRRATMGRRRRAVLGAAMQWAVVLIAGFFTWALYSASPDLLAAASRRPAADLGAVRARPADIGGDAIVGRASVVDGDTIEVRRLRVRLHAIDAPESRQTCRIDGRPWPCGRRAAGALASLIGARNVACVRRDTDRYGRTVAVCRAGEVDVGGWMVENGWALAYRQYGADYVMEEIAARLARRGLWQGSFVPPWRFRRGDRDEVGVVSYSLD